MDAGTCDASEIRTGASDAGVRRARRTIIGLGNELLSDDGVGIRVVRELKKRLPDETARFEELSIGGLALLDYVSGSDECIVIDAIATGEHPPGTLYRWVEENPDTTVPMRSSHQIDLMQVVRLAGLLGADIPRRIIVYGIEAADISTFHEGCTAAIESAIPLLVERICLDLQDSGRTPDTAPDTSTVIQHTLSD